MAFPYRVEVVDGVAWYLDTTRLCRSDGTNGGTACFDIPAKDYSTADRGFVLNGKFYTVILEPGRQTLYAFDGRTGPQPVIEFAPGEISPREFRKSVATNGTYLFYPRPRTFGGIELMRTDATGAGATVVTTLLTDQVDMVFGIGNSVFMWARNTDHWHGTGARLWASDGTEEGTDFIGGADAFRLIPLGRLALFHRNGRLWRTDGTTAGTFALSGTIQGEVGIAGDSAFFTSNGAVWRTDGTTTTALRTVTFQPFHTGMASSRILLLQRENNLLHVWSASTTAGALARIRTIRVEPRSNAPTVGYAGGLAYLFVSTPDGPELWRTDGTAPGTFIVSTESFSTSAVAELRGKLFYFADDRVHGLEPWISDGTRDGTHMVANIDPEGSVRGVVTDATSGQPIAGAIVETFLYSRISTITASDGSYTLAGLRPTWNDPVHVRATGYVADWVSFSVKANEQTVEDVALQRGSRITGKVVDASGAPLAGIDVTLTFNGDTRRTTTSAIGRYELDGVDPRWDWTLVIGARDYASFVEPAPVRLTPGETREIDVTLQRLGRLRIHLVSASTQEPLRSTFGTLSFYTSTSRTLEAWASVSERNPVVEIALPDGTYHVLGSLYHHAPTWFPRTECLDACVTGRAGGRGTALQVTAGTTREVDFVVRPLRGQIYGVVIDAVSGAHVAVGNVRVRDEQGSSHRAIRPRANDGSFETGPFLTAGTYTISFDENWYEEYGYLSIPHPPVHVGEGDVVRVELRVTRGATIRGRVTDAVTGKPIPSVILRATPSNRQGWTDANGSYTIIGLATGTYQLVAERAPYKPEAVEVPVTVTAGDKTIVHIVMRQP